MFARRVLKNIFRRKSIGNGKTILITRRLCSQHQLDDSANDIIVSSPLPSINYPECSLDQYVWNDFNKWSSKVALVRKNRKNRQALMINFVWFRWTVSPNEVWLTGNCEIGAVPWLFGCNHCFNCVVVTSLEFVSRTQSNSRLCAWLAVKLVSLSQPLIQSTPLVKIYFYCYWSSICLGDLDCHGEFLSWGFVFFLCNDGR